MESACADNHQVVEEAAIRMQTLQEQDGDCADHPAVCGEAAVPGNKYTPFRCVGIYADFLVLVEYEYRHKDVHESVGG